MVVLLVTYNVYHLVDRVVAETELCGTDILCHVYRCTVAAQQELLVESFLCEVGPYRLILPAVEESLLESAEYGLLTHEVCVALVVDLVKINAQALVGLVEALINPVVHLLPECAYLLVACLPLDEHLACFCHQWRCGLGLLLAHAFLHKLGQLGLVVLVECYIVVADEVVTLLAAALGCSALAPLLPSEHRLTDVYASVVHDVGLYNPVTICCNDVREGITEQVVAYVAKVERLVCIW